MTPWSVRPSAGWPKSAARAASASILQAPSSSEYSEWTWRWAHGGSAHGRGRLDAGSDGLGAGRRLPAPCGKRRQPALGAVGPGLQRGDRGVASPRISRALARRPGSSRRSRSRRPATGHVASAGRSRLGASPDLDRRAVGDGRRASAPARARDLLGDRERVPLGPRRVDRVGEERGARGRGRARRPRGRAARGSAALPASGRAASRRRGGGRDADRPAPAADALLDAGEQLGERERVGARRGRRRSSAAAARSISLAVAPRLGDGDGVRPGLADREVVVERLGRSAVLGRDEAGAAAARPRRVVVRELDERAAQRRVLALERRSRRRGPAARAR